MTALGVVDHRAQTVQQGVLHPVRVRRPALLVSLASMTALGVVDHRAQTVQQGSTLLLLGLRLQQPASHAAQDLLVAQEPLFALRARRESMPPGDQEPVQTAEPVSSATPPVIPWSLSVLNATMGSMRKELAPLSAPLVPPADI